MVLWIGSEGSCKKAGGGHMVMGGVGICVARNHGQGRGFGGVWSSRYTLLVLTVGMFWSRQNISIASRKCGKKSPVGYS